MAEITDSLARSVQDYYASVLSSSEDLQTSACCAVEAPPDRVRTALKLVHPEVVARPSGGATVPAPEAPAASPAAEPGS